MSARFVIAGTDTGVGKTVFASALVDALSACYWKPVQAGLEPETDTDCVARLSGASASRLLPEAYRLRTPASPHYAARLDGRVIDAAALTPPDCAAPLIVETAGGVLSPLTRETPTADVLALWRIPVILVGRTSLGAINHALLSIEALRRRAIPLHGFVFCGDENIETQETIVDMGKLRSLGRLPPLAPLTRETLRGAFAQAFDIGDFLE